MDSGGNSGSMQSSSGGDEEYDSRAHHDSISVFLNNNNHNHVVVCGPMSSNQPPPPPPHQQPQPHHFNNQQSIFDPLSNYFTNNSNSLLNLDLLNWSKNIRSDHTDLAAFIAPTHQFFTTQPPPPQNRPSFQIPQLQPSSGSGSANLNDQTNNNTSSGAGGGNVVRNPKKRSRASRRAPTTVLTTDTTNFRAMVQEFTGIPAPPFTSSSYSSPFPIRSRLDLFGNSSSSTFRSATHFESPSPPPSYLLRPFAQKIQHPPPPCSSSSSSSMAADAIVSTTTTTTNVNSDLGVLNPLLNFHPLFHSSSASNSTKLPLSNNMKTHHQLEIPASDHNSNHNLKMGIFEEDFGLGPVNNWGGGGDDEDDRNGNGNGLLRSINGNYTASDQNNVATTTTSHEGIMESWICSSD